MYLVTQKISNHPIIPNIERYVQVFSIDVNKKASVLKIGYDIKYTRSGIDISRQLSNITPPWIVSNAYRVKIRDEDDNLIPNPDYNPEDPESEEFLMDYAFDHFLNISFNAENPVNIKELIKKYIILDDVENKRFDII